MTFLFTSSGFSFDNYHIQQTCFQICNIKLFKRVIYSWFWVHIGSHGLELMRRNDQASFSSTHVSRGPNWSFPVSHQAGSRQQKGRPCTLDRNSWRAAINRLPMRAEALLGHKWWMYSWIKSLKIAGSQWYHTCSPCWGRGTMNSRIG